MIERTIAWFNKNVFNSTKTSLSVAIGSNVPYAKYVYKMRGVNWTNPRTAEIEGRFFTETKLELIKELRRHISRSLSAAGFGWMMGTRAVPRTITKPSGTEIPGYRGKGKIIQWV